MAKTATITLEEWKPLNDCEGRYEISNFGNIRSKRTNLKLFKNKSGYYTIALWINGKHSTKIIHRLVAEAFIPNPNNYPIINHKDGNKINNHIDNLEWCSYSENLIHAYNTGLTKPKRERSIQQICLETGSVIATFQSLREAERQTGIKRSNICFCLKGKYTQSGGFKWSYL